MMRDAGNSSVPIGVCNPLQISPRSLSEGGNVVMSVMCGSVGKAPNKKWSEVNGVEQNEGAKSDTLIGIDFEAFRLNHVSKSAMLNVEHLL